MRELRVQGHYYFPRFGKCETRGREEKREKIECFGANRHHCREAVTLWPGWSWRATSRSFASRALWMMRSIGLRKALTRRYISPLPSSLSLSSPFPIFSGSPLWLYFLFCIFLICSQTLFISAEDMKESKIIYPPQLDEFPSLKYVLTPPYPPTHPPTLHQLTPTHLLVYLYHLTTSAHQD